MVDKIRSWLRVLFPVVNGLLIIAFTMILVWQGWPIETSEMRLKYIGAGLIGFIVIDGLWYFMTKIGSISANVFGNSIDVKGADDE